MARFTITTRTRDEDENTVSESINVNAGPAIFDIPEVSFAYPNNVSVQEGGGGGPIWGTSSFRGFAYVKVTPTPSSRGTGSFYVQHYYNSGVYPNNPSHRFLQTFDGVGTTIAQSYSFATDQLSLNDGGGVGTSGFASSTDVSGLRKALVLSVDIQDQQEPNPNGVNNTNPARLGERVPDTDGIITVYDHDTTTDLLQTIRVIQKGKETSGGADRTSWPDNTFIFLHPYHYTPVYENNTGSTYQVMPYTLIIEDGVSNPMRGQITVSGTQVTGLYTDFNADISGVYSDQAVIRFNDTSDWYIISGVTSSSGLVIYDYGDNPYYSGVSAEVTYYAIGSGLVNILPDLSGCNLWDVELSPKYLDGSTIPSNSVTYTANITGTQVSGTATYDWTVTTVSSSGTVTSGATNAGNTLTVGYEEGLNINVEVAVSGSGQPACIHDDQTGLIELKPAVAAGIWSPYQFTQVGEANGENIYSNVHEWFRRGTAADSDVYFHHQQKQYQTLRALIQINGDLRLWFSEPDEGTNTLTAELGAFDNWPDAGGIVLFHRGSSFQPPVYNTSSSEISYIYGSYSGKSKTANGDRLNNIKWYKRTKTIVPDSAGEVMSAGVPQRIFNGTAWVLFHSPMHWPMTYIVGKSSNGTTLTVEDSRKIADCFVSSPKKFWVVPRGQGGSTYSYTLTLQTVNHPTNQMTFFETMPSNIGLEGQQLIPALPYHPRNGASLNADPSVDPAWWNFTEQSMLQVVRITSSPDLFVQSDVQAETQTEILQNPGAGELVPRTQDYNSFNSEPGSYEFTINQPVTIWCHDPMGWTARGYAITQSLNVWSYSYLTYWLPYRGRLVIPDKTRGNIIVSYQSRDVFPRPLNDSDVFVRFNNCIPVASLTTAPTITKNNNLYYQYKNRGIAYIHRELEDAGGVSLSTLDSTNPNLGYIGLGFGSLYDGNDNRFYRALYSSSLWADFIQANKSQDEIVGEVGQQQSAPIWERVITGWVDGAIPQVDPVYRGIGEPEDPEAGDTQGGGGGSTPFDPTTSLG